jgi:hypothetical protein
LRGIWQCRATQNHPGTKSIGVFESDSEQPSDLRPHDKRHVDLFRRALQDLRSRRVIPYVKVGKKTILYADEVINYCAEDVFQRAKAIAGDRGMDAIVDTIGPSNGIDNLALLGPEGGVAAENC